MSVSSVSLLVLFVALASAAPKYEETVFANLTEDGHVEIEDYILSMDDFLELYPIDGPVPGNPAQTRHRRAAVSDPRKMWTNAEIPYTVDRSLSNIQSMIQSAMSEWSQKTCIKFRPRTSSDRNYLLITAMQPETGFRSPAQGCRSSFLGMSGRGMQYVTLPNTCWQHRIILHELGHVIGLVHEHSHPKRDQYLTIYWDKVARAQNFGNFQIHNGASDWGIAYDPLSIMHYPAGDPKCRGGKAQCWDMESKSGDSVTNLFASSNHLSEKSDVPIVKKMYKCPGYVQDDPSTYTIQRGDSKPGNVNTNVRQPVNPNIRQPVNPIIRQPYPIIRQPYPIIRQPFNPYIRQPFNPYIRQPIYPVWG